MPAVLCHGDVSEEQPSPITPQVGKTHYLMSKITKVHMYVQCILAFLSQSEMIYWNMQSKVPGQLEAK